MAYTLLFCFYKTKLFLEKERERNWNTISGIIGQFLDLLCSGEGSGSERRRNCLFACLYVYNIFLVAVWPFVQRYSSHKIKILTSSPHNGVSYVDAVFVSINTWNKWKTNFYKPQKNMKTYNTHQFQTYLLI